MAHEAENVKMMLEVAKNEIETIQKYVELVSTLDTDEVVDDRLYEIIADEFNHALISIYTASAAIGIKIPSDGLLTAMEDADFVEGNGDE